MVIKREADAISIGCAGVSSMGYGCKQLAASAKKLKGTRSDGASRIVDQGSTKTSGIDRREVTAAGGPGSWGFEGPENVQPGVQRNGLLLLVK